MDLFDRRGKPSLHSPDGKFLYRWNGRVFAFINGDAVYDFKGRAVGRLANGWLRDNQGNAVLFAPGASGGPMTPMTAMAPLKALTQLPPLPPLPSLPPLAPFPTLSWSRLTFEDLLR